MAINENNSSKRDSLLEPCVFLFSSAYFNNVSRKKDMNSLSDYLVFRDHLSLDNIIFELSLTEAFENATDIRLDRVYDPVTSWAFRDKPSAMQVSANAERYKNELYSTILPSLQTDKVKTYALDGYLKLKVTEDSVCETIEIFELRKTVSEVPYRVVVSSGNVYIIVEEGFLSHLEDVSSKKGFYSVVLKALYSLDRINNVNRTAWYRKYVEVLCSLV